MRWNYRQDFKRDVLANIIADLRREMRAAFESEIGLIKRELAVLRTEVAVRNLQSEVADARANISKLPDVEARLDAKQAETRKRARSPEARVGRDEGPAHRRSRRALSDPVQLELIGEQVAEAGGHGHADHAGLQLRREGRRSRDDGRLAAAGGERLRVPIPTRRG